MIKISYKDGQNWTDINGNVRNWTNAYDLYKDKRVQAAYLAPEITTDIWNGKIHDVQHIIWDMWHLEFWIKESELQEVNKLKSCSIITLTDIDNNLNHTVDMQSGDFLNFSEPERVADTSNWQVIIEYRTNKTIINKINALSDKVTITLNSTFYSKFAKVNYTNELLQKLKQWDSSLNKPLISSNKQGNNILLYLSESELATFKSEYNRYELSIDAVNVIEKLPLEISEIGEDLYKVLFSGITSSNDYIISYPNVVTLQGASTYYSKFSKKQYIGATEQVTVKWYDGTTKILRETNKKGYTVYLYLSDSELETFRNDYNQNSFTIDSVPVLEKLSLEVAADEFGYYDVTLNLITDTDITTNNLGASTTNSLVISDGSTYTYYSDYPVISKTEDTATETYENETGIKTLAKAITRDVRIFKYWGTGANSFALKKHFEVGTATINSTTILENRTVEVNELDYDLYECVVECLVDTDINYPQA